MYPTESWDLRDTLDMTKRTADMLIGVVVDGFFRLLALEIYKWNLIYLHPLPGKLNLLIHRMSYRGSG